LEATEHVDERPFRPSIDGVAREARVYREARDR
jgi:hypothetical protein